LQKEKASETLIEFIRRIGCQKVMDLNIQVDYNNLVSKTTSDSNSAELHVVDGIWLINTHSSGQAKVKQIKTIAKELHLEIKVFLL